MNAFEDAAAQGLKSIELDIWLSADNEFVVIHGGDNGELPKPVNILDNGSNEDTTNKLKEPSYIFKCTYDEIQR